jgi:tetratricopeptide (TPR) repeat protein
MKRMGAALSAAPFWQRLTDFLQYPFSPIGAVLLVIAFIVPLFAGDGSAIAYGASAVVLAIVVKYAWTALEKVSGGDVAPAGPDTLLKAQNNELAFGIAAIVIGLCALVGYVYLKDRFYGTLLAAIGLGVMPAMLIAAGTNRSFNAALSGEGLKSALAGVGPVYAALVILSLILFAALQSVVSIFADILPLAWGRAMALSAYTYFIIVLFSLSGYVLFQFQEALGFTPSIGGKVRKSVKRGDPAILQMEMFLKEGNYSRATTVLRNETQRKGATLTAHERYHKLIWAMSDEQALRNHASAYFRALLESGRESQLVSLMRAYNQRIPGYRPEDPDVCLDLAEAFERIGDYKLAVHVLNGLHKDAPHYARLPEAYLLAARVLADKLEMPQKGLALVQFLDGRFKMHKSYPAIRQALQALTAQVKAI